MEDNRGRKADYPEHEDGLILWAQSAGVEKKYFEARPIGAAYRVIQRSAYRSLVGRVAELMTSPPRSLDNFTVMSELLGFSEPEQLCVLWWMRDRKRVLIEISEGRTPAVHQIPMPVFYGRRQGIGKSYLVLKLCEIFDDLAEVKNISEIEDKFNYLQWGKLLVANFDEMAGLDKTDMNLLKQWAFQKKFTKRKMQSELQNHIERTVGGIGSSNDPIEEIVWDSTGTRRFCQINVPHDGRYIVASDNLDFISIWQSIDHKKTLSDSEKQIIRDEQELHRRKDKVELWFEDAGRGLFNDRVNINDGWVSGIDLYENFKIWCDNGREKAYTNTKFGRSLLVIYEGVIEKMRSNGAKYRLTHY